MFNPWKKAKQHREATKFAEAYFKAQQDAGEWFTEAEQSGVDFTNGMDNDNDIIYYYAKNVYKLYDTIEANRNEFLTAMENEVVISLNAIVEHNKHISLNDLLNEAIVIRYDNKNGSLIMPQCIRFYDLGNGMVRIGKEKAVV
jgi:hypothetical protein